VGAAVGVGVRVGAGVDVGVGVGAGAETATTMSAALATTTAAVAAAFFTTVGLGEGLFLPEPFFVLADVFFVVADVFFVGVFLLVTVAVIVWAPTAAPLGTTKATDIRPARSTRKVGMPLVAPSKASWPRLLGASPWPRAVTVVPAAAWLGERLIELVALATASGIRMTGTRRATTRSRKESLVKRLWRPVTGRAPVRTESGAALYRIG
jgi:hypothetical protein